MVGASSTVKRAESAPSVTACPGVRDSIEVTASVAETPTIAANASADLANNWLTLSLL